MVMVIKHKITADYSLYIIQLDYHSKLPKHVISGLVSNWQEQKMLT
jgi:hypothetical protein